MLTALQHFILKYIYIIYFYILLLYLYVLQNTIDVQTDIFFVYLSRSLPFIQTFILSKPSVKLPKHSISISQLGIPFIISNTVFQEHDIQVSTRLPAPARLQDVRLSTCNISSTTPSLFMELKDRSILRLQRYHFGFQLFILIPLQFL